MSIDINKIRKDFPILNTKVYNVPLVYLDNGATTQKPQVVIDEVNKLYSAENSNIHRGVHYLSDKLTQKFEDARGTVKEFINAKSSKEIIFSSGTTQSINTIAYSFGDKYVNEGDEIIISTLEHHSNIVPWQMLCERKKAILKIIPITDSGELIFEEFEKLISDKTKLVAITRVSNAIGIVNNVKKIIKLSHKYNAKVLIDGAQSIQHEITDVTDLDCDFFVFSGHKIYGPNGIGVIYGKEELLNEMPPFLTGGEMISKVSFEKTTFNELPFKFEAGTPNYIGAVGLAKAINYISEIGIEDIAKYEKGLINYAIEKLSSIPEVQIIGTSKNKSGSLSFILKGIHFFDAGLVYDKMGIAVRTGTHCAEPLMKRFNIDGTIRASFAFYNTKEEIDKLFNTTIKIIQMFG